MVQASLTLLRSHLKKMSQQEKLPKGFARHSSSTCNPEYCCLKREVANLSVDEEPHLVLGHPHGFYGYCRKSLAMIYQ